MWTDILYPAVGIVLGWLGVKGASMVGAVRRDRAVAAAELVRDVATAVLAILGPSTAIVGADDDVFNATLEKLIRSAAARMDVPDPPGVFVRQVRRLVTKELIARAFARLEREAIEAGPRFEALADKAKRGGQ